MYIIIPGQKAVKPTMSKPNANDESITAQRYLGEIRKFNDHLLTLPTYSLHESLKDLPVNTELQDDKVREQWQYKYPRDSYWCNGKAPMGSEDIPTRVVLVPIEEEKGKEGRYWYTDDEFPGIKLRMDGVREFVESFFHYELSEEKLTELLKGIGYWGCHQVARLTPHPSNKGEGEERVFTLEEMEHCFRDAVFATGAARTHKQDDVKRAMQIYFKAKFGITLK